MIWTRRNRLILGPALLIAGLGIWWLPGTPDDPWHLTGFWMTYLLFGLNLSTVPPLLTKPTQIGALALLGLITLVSAAGVALVNGHPEYGFTRTVVLDLSGMGVGFLLGAALHYGRLLRNGGAP